MVAQAHSKTRPTLAKVKEWLAIAGIIVAVGGGLLGGMKLVIAPLHADIRAIHGRLDRMDARFDRMDGRFQQLEQAVSDLGQRLASIATLLQKDAGQ